MFLYKNRECIFHLYILNADINSFSSHCVRACVCKQFDADSCYPEHRAYRGIGVLLAFLISLQKPGAEQKDSDFRILLNSLCLCPSCPILQPRVRCLV